MAAITTAVIGAAGAVYSAKKSSDNAKKAAKQGEAAVAAADPYAPYRDDAAQKLNALVADPTSISNTATYKARLQAAERTVAAAGYTGSGNAVIAAADAGAAAYQQEFENLSMLAGASNGTQNAASAAANAANVNSEANAQKLSSYTGVVNNATNLAKTIGNYNKPAPVTTGG